VPGFNGRGPRNKGPMTGAGVGRCRLMGDSRNSESIEPPAGAGGFRKGQGRGRRRPGGGLGRRRELGCWEGTRQSNVSANPLPVDWDDQVSLREELEAVRLQAEALSKRIAELDNKG
jgi:hypothetical protein